MMTGTRTAGWVGVGCAVGVALTTGWDAARAQTDDTRLKALQGALQEAQRGPNPKVYSGADVGFRVVPGRAGDRPVVVPVARINGDWVEVEFGGGGIRKLTQ